MIRKLLAAGAVLTVAVIAVMLMSVGSGTKSAEAHVQSISGPAFISPALIGLAEIHVVAQEGHGDIRITASSGAFATCEYQDATPCETYGEVGTLFPGFLWSSAYVCDDPSVDCALGGDVDFLTLLWGMPEGFPGGAVLFTACQADQACPATAKIFTMQVGGAPATVKLVAQRDYTNSDTTCTGTPVYVIASVEYSYNNVTSFNNGRAIMCAEVRDSAGHLLTGEQVAWTVSGGGCLDVMVTNTLTNGVTHNRLESCTTGNSGDVATVVAQAGGVFSNAVEVEFGGDPASCSIPDFPADLDIGDTAHFTATFVDELGNKVPDGIIAHIEEVDSGDGADNVDVVSDIEDTVNSTVEGDIIGAISGVTTIAVSLETIAGPDTTCSEALELTGDIHVTPTDCDDPDMILFGNAPPAGGGFGTFAFCGGTWEQLLDASNCPKATAVFFYNKPDGGFAVWIPGTTVAAANAEILAIFPNEHTPIPEGTIFTAKCK